MKVCVFGGTGFVGRRVVRQMAAEGHDVVCLDVNALPIFEDLGRQVIVERVDLTDFEDVVSTLANHRPQIVINLSYMRDNLPRPAMRLNILGMDNCFEASRLFDVEHVVYSSSIAVNGSQLPYGKRKILETDAPHVGKQYAVHKVFNEWQAKEYREKHGMLITGVRAAHVSGTDKLIGSVDHVECIVGPALGRAVEFEYRDWMRCIIHGDDVARVFATIACADKPKHEIYNSGGETLSMGDLADIVKVTIPDADIRFRHQTGGYERSTGHIYANDRLVSEFGLQYMPYAERVPLMIDSVRRGAALG